MTNAHRAAIQLTLLVSIALTGPADAREKNKLAEPPWLLANYLYDFGDEESFTEYSVNLLIRNTPPADALYVIAPAANILIGDTSLRLAFYSQLPAGDGPGFEFVRTGAGTPKDVRVAKGARLTRGPPDQLTIGAALPFRWAKGLYTIRIKPQSQITRFGKTTTWIGGTVINHASGKDVDIGMIRFEGEEIPTMSGTMSAQILWNGGAIAPDTFPALGVQMDHWRLDNKHVVPRSATVVYPRDVPQVVSSKPQGTAVVATVARPVRRDREKGVFEQETGFVRLLFTRPLEK